MKRNITLGTLLTMLGLLVSGCFLKSVHPLVHQNESKLVEGLEGVWEGDDSRWYFIHDMNNFRNFMGSDDNPYADDSPAQQGSDSYYVFYETKFQGKQDTTLFIGSTIELNANHYLDLYATESDLPELVGNHFFPVHTFSRILIKNDQLTIELFEDEWIRDQIINNRIRLKHEQIGGQGQSVLITASTRELQGFVKKYGDDESAYEDPIKLQRVK